MKLHIAIKFRAFGITIGSFDQTFDIDQALASFGFSKNPEAAVVEGAVVSEVSHVVLADHDEQSIYHGHGVLVELLKA